MTPARDLRVVAVDATPLVRAGLRTVIEHAAGLHWLGAVEHPQTMLAALTKVRPHIVILDSAVDPLGTLIRDLIATAPAPTVVALFDEHHRSAAHLRTARVAGAHGMVRHDATPTRLVTAIRHAHATGRFVDPDLVPADEPRQRPASAPLLTSRQREVLDMIAEGMSEGAIAARLVVSQDTVRSHIKHLRQRLGAKDRAHAVARGYHLGVLPAPVGDAS